MTKYSRVKFSGLKVGDKIISTSNDVDCISKHKEYEVFHDGEDFYIACSEGCHALINDMDFLDDNGCIPGFIKEVS